MVRIAEISGGNPSYSLDLARAIHDGLTRAPPGAPATLAELMRLRIGSLDVQAGDVLLAAAAMAYPALDVLAQVVGMTVDQVVELLEEAESKGIIEIECNRVRFSHP